jgi:type III secretory pathway component EscV
MAESIRPSLSRQISYTFGGQDKQLSAILLSGDIEILIKGLIPTEENPQPAAIAHETHMQIIKAVEGLLSKDGAQRASTVIVTDAEIRLYIRNLVRPYFKGLSVLAFQEINPDIAVDSLGYVQIQ